MPKRVIDGEGLWRSDKLAQVEPPSYRAEYANLVPLALANGSFEATPRRIWSAVYSFNRPDVPLDLVDPILTELERVRLLFRWTDPATGKVWGYWTGIDKPGRLPGRSRRGRNEAVGLDPPQDQLRKFLDSNGIHEALNGNEKLLGFGFGSGSGSGSGINPSSEQKGRSDQERSSPKSKTQEPSREAHRLAALLKAEILRNSPNFRFTQKQERSWAITADLMLRRDGRSAERIADLIVWCQSNDFEKSNVLSMDKLRARFDALELKQRTRSNGKAVPKPIIAGSWVENERQMRGGS